MNSASSQSSLATYRWSGSAKLYLDTPAISTCEQVVVGCYGGNTKAGAQKNEDGALVWCDKEQNWEFALIVDAHYTPQSADLLLDAIESIQPAIVEALTQPISTAFFSLQQHIVTLLGSPAFLKRCREVIGEASCLFCARKDRFLWWLNIGDCVLYLLHPELAYMGQIPLNQRSFFEWVGRTNTFELPVPCFSSGIKELRFGWNRILLVTDGLLEYGSRPYDNPFRLYQAFTDRQEVRETNLSALVQHALKRVHKEKGRDSATIIVWDYYNRQGATYSAP
ncbi:serine/threonine protein phosphatase PrpC [Thermosporothrix hazakensis]|uniref:Serine/threonine protein phosphatase PrpC n=2 Tax=Thermosporothrix TaxID=768650 RepID=A0A326UA76_THEHA|nr:protein phosphatase 2C domain-containing protein [Thermosporothrix hazakensis]PZW24241.1 serine/threonine protein phosphatase PrpC [Thermosporothrix hazakensis]BBH89686.1 protein phosphatase [Thermosporothrix sp. COM3]GCE47872.1 protein phosphatase [Thermosporothrix hazakensis]